MAIEATNGRAGMSGSILRRLIIEFNELQANVVAIAAKLDADAGVTDTNYNAQVTADQIGDHSGTAITA